MAFKSFLNFKYSNTHENRIWNKLVHVLQAEYGSIDEEVYLVGNLLADGKELDALLVKEDAVIVIDFKDYGGTLVISENEPWTISGIEINSNRKNPFAQLSDNKYAVLATLKKKLPSGYESWINIGHINALALFHQSINYDIDRLSHDLSHSASKWFNVCDFQNFIMHIGEITSKQTSLRGERAQILLNALGVSVDKFIKGNTSPQQQNEDKTVEVIDTSSSDVNFAELYYKKAKKLSSIKVLIVGQDPYPSGANGVAFCKDNYYALYVEEPEPAGATVLKSMGIDMEKARKIGYKNPKVLFYELLTKSGICFVNVYNKLYDQLNVEDRKAVAEETAKFNLPIVEKAESIILLGKGITKTTFENYYKGINYSHVLIHPSLRAKETNLSEWTETWENNKLENLWIE